LLLKHEDKVFYYLEKAERDHYAFKDCEDYIKETLEKYQRLTITLKQMLKKQEESETKKGMELEEKEEEIKRLKNEIISQS
jgi:hypothetical protein